MWSEDFSLNLIEGILTFKLATQHLNRELMYVSNCVSTRISKKKFCLVENIKKNVFAFIYCQ